MVGEHENGARNAQQSKRARDGPEPRLRARVPPPLSLLLARAGNRFLGSWRRDVVTLAEHFQDVREGNASQAACRRGKHKHEPHHDRGKVNAQHAPNHKKQGPLRERPEAGDDARPHQDDSKPKVVDEGRPGWSLVLAHTGDDWNVLGRVRWVQQAETPSRPPQRGRRHCEGDDCEGDNPHDADARGDKQPQRLVVRRFGQSPLQVLDKSNPVHQCQDKESTEMLRGLHRVEADHWKHHGQHSTVDDEHGVPRVQVRAELVDNQQSQRVDRDQVDNEGVPSPGGNHVKVRETRTHAPKHAARLDGLEVKVESEGEGEDRHSFVVIRSRNAPRDVARNRRNETRCQQARSPGPHLPDHEVGRYRREAAEEGADHHTNVLHVHGVELEDILQHLVQPSRRKGEPRVDGAAHDSTERVPSALVEEVPERIDAFLARQLRDPVIEVGVELVYDALVLYNAKEPDGEGHRGDEHQSCYFNGRRNG
mmetsp:Transcript_4240/g.12376  ORF Transcript_4240/g.12376 Transcript_4240/m.12376 type:complete len:480 (+) Transcript_4240:1351-2790(+)